MCAAQALHRETMCNLHLSIHYSFLTIYWKVFQFVRGEGISHQSWTSGSDVKREELLFSRVSLSLQIASVLVASILQHG